MNFRHGVTLALTFVILSLSGVSYAQKASVVILKFDQFNVDPTVASAFDSSLQKGISEHSEMEVKTSGELTVQDLVLAAGCDAPSVECLGGLGGMVGSDQLIFGAVQQSDDVVMFSIRQFDFAEQRFIRDVSEATVRGTPGQIIDALPAVVDNFLYGPIGRVEILVGQGTPELFLNGDKVGRAPTVLENLPLGEHVIMVRNADGSEESKTVILRRGATQEVEFAMSENTQPETVSSGPSSIPGWILVGVGAAGLGFGIFQTLEVGRIDDEFAALCSEPGNTCEGPEASLGGPEAASRARSLTDDGGTAKTMQLIGFSVGGAALAVGGYLLFRAYTHSEEESLSFHVSPTKGGVSAGMGLSF